MSPGDENVLLLRNPENDENLGWTGTYHVVQYWARNYAKAMTSRHTTKQGADHFVKYLSQQPEITTINRFVVTVKEDR